MQQVSLKTNDFLKAHSLLRKTPVNVTLTINYDANTYYLLRIIGWKIIERLQNIIYTLHLAVAECIDVMGSRLSCHWLNRLIRQLSMF